MKPVYFMAVLLIVCSILMTSLQSIQIMLTAVTKVTQNSAEITEIWHYIFEIIDTIDTNDQRLDSKHSSWQKYIQAIIQEAANKDISLYFSDESSRLNPNWIDEELLFSTEVAKLLCRTEKSKLELQELFKKQRESNYPRLSINKQYAEIFSDAAFDQYLTAFSWPSIDFDKPELFNYIITEPQININYIDPTLLDALLSSEIFGIQNPKSIGEKIIQLRADNSIRKDMIFSLLEVDEKHPLSLYLGVKTFFWRIYAYSANYEVSAVIATAPTKTTEQTCENCRQFPSPGIIWFESKRRPPINNS